MTTDQLGVRLVYCMFLYGYSLVLETLSRDNTKETSIQNLGRV